MEGRNWWDVVLGRRGRGRYGSRGVGRGDEEATWEGEGAAAESGDGNVGLVRVGGGKEGGRRGHFRMLGSGINI